MYFTSFRGFWLNGIKSCCGVFYGKESSLNLRIISSCFDDAFLGVYGTFPMSTKLIILDKIALVSRESPGFVVSLATQVSHIVIL